MLAKYHFLLGNSYTFQGLLNELLEISQFPKRKFRVKPEERKTKPFADLIQALACRQQTLAICCLMSSFCLNSKMMMFAKRNQTHSVCKCSSFSFNSCISVVISASLRLDWALNCAIDVTAASRSLVLSAT